MKFKDIPQFTSDGNYQCDTPWDYLLDAIQRYIDEYHLDMNPDFQRGHVWDDAKRIAYVETSEEIEKVKRLLEQEKADSR